MRIAVKDPGRTQMVRVRALGEPTDWVWIHLLPVVSPREPQSPRLEKEITCPTASGVRALCGCGLAGSGSCHSQCSEQGLTFIVIPFHECRPLVFIECLLWARVAVPSDLGYSLRACCALRADHLCPASGPWDSARPHSYCVLEPGFELESNCSV